jgi:hypothetical protein
MALRDRRRTAAFIELNQVRTNSVNGALLTLQMMACCGADP